MLYVVYGKHVEDEGAPIIASVRQGFSSSHGSGGGHPRLHLLSKMSPVQHCAILICVMTRSLPVSYASVVLSDNRLGRVLKTWKSIVRRVLTIDFHVFKTLHVFTND